MVNIFIGNRKGSFPPRRYGSLVGLALLVWLGLSACEWKQRSPAGTRPGASAWGRTAQSIIRGDVDLSQPAIGALMADGVIFCTGTLIAPRIVLTAAHCVTPLKSNERRKWQFRVDLPTGKDTFQSLRAAIDAEASQAHPEFGLGTNIKHDIGVVVLDAKDALFGVEPMAMMTTPISKGSLGRSLRVVGYGRTSSTARVTSPLKRSVSLQLVALEPIDPYTRQPKQHVMLLDAHQRSACQGDSGGPALLRVDGKLRIAGISSHISNPSCRGQTYSFQVAPYQGWLQGLLSQHSTCRGAAPTCGACSTCDSDRCKWPAAKGPGCERCSVDRDCANGGRCIPLRDGRRCVQPCAPSGCCGQGLTCSQLAGQSARYCIPSALSCTTTSCSSDKECSDAMTCIQGTCQPAGAPRAATTCHPCKNDRECGTNGTCFRPNGLGGRCLQACQGSARSCPQEFRCERLPTGEQRCVPDDLTCRIPCDKGPCPSGWSCQNKLCQPPGGGQKGDPCAPDLPCAATLRCSESQMGSRCYQPCGPTAGQVGGPCLEGRRCAEGLLCHATKTGKEYCVETCSPGNSCTQGGKCRGVCVCDQDSDCKTGQICPALNLSNGRGICRDPKESPCGPGERCTDNDVCVPQNAGVGGLWQPCDALYPCRQGLICIPELRRCLKTCQSQADCQGAGQCIGDGPRFCACTQDADCGASKRCQPVETAGPGYCVENPKSCPSTGCPTGQHCQLDRCVPIAAEISQEPATSDESISPEPQADSPDGGVTEPSEDATTLDRSLQESLPGKGCGCSQAPAPRGHMGWWCLLALWLLWRRRGRSRLAHR